MNNTITANGNMAGYVIGTVSGAMVMATPSISLGNAIVASTAINTHKHGVT